MRRRFSLIIMLVAWLFATGSHWDLVQTFAWGRMIATYAQTMPLAQAVKLTFTPDNLCSVCEAVSEAKQHPADPALPLEAGGAGKIPLVFQPAPAFVLTLSPARADVRPTTWRWASADRSPPPTPPPRASV